MTVIDIKLSAIYDAAHHALPAKATDFANHAEDSSGAIDAIAAQLALAGNHPIATDLADISVELFVHLRSMARTFSDSAIALDRIADNFVAADSEAAAWFSQHQQYVGDPDVPADPTPPEV